MTSVGVILLLIGAGAVFLGLKSLGATGRDLRSVLLASGSDRNKFSESALPTLALSGCAFLALWALLEFEIAISFAIGLVVCLLASLPSLLKSADENTSTEDPDAAISLLEIGSLCLGFAVICLIYLRLAEVQLLLALAVGLAFGGFLFGRVSGRRALDQLAAISAGAAAVALTAAPSFFTNISGQVSTILLFVGLIAASRFISFRILAHYGSILHGRNLSSELTSSLVLIALAAVASIVWVPTFLDTFFLALGIFVALLLSDASFQWIKTKINLKAKIFDESRMFFGLTVAGAIAAGSSVLGGPFALGLAALGAVAVATDKNSADPFSSKSALAMGLEAVLYFCVLGASFGRELVDPQKIGNSPILFASGVLLATLVYSLITISYERKEDEQSDFWTLTLVGVTSLLLACILGRQILAGIVLGLGLLVCFGRSANSAGEMNSLVRIFSLLALLVGGAW